MPATTTGPGVHRRPAGAIARWLAGASGLGHLTTSVLVLGLGYTGRPALAAVPLSAAWLRLRLLPGPAPALRRLRLHLPLLALLLTSALVSALLHPSAQAAGFLASLVACCAFTVLLAAGPQSQLTWLCLATATALSALLVVAAALGDPRLFAAKTPLGLPWLVSRLAGGIGPGRGVVHPNGVGVLASVTAAGWVGAAVALGTARRRLAALLAALAVAGLLLVTGSRGGLVAFAGASLAALVGGRRAALRGAVAAGCLAALALTALLAGVPADDGSAGPRAPSSALGSALQELGRRAAVWRGTGAAIGDSPWTGRGIGSFVHAYSPSPAAPQPVNSHDALLQVWLDVGAGGALAVTGLTVHAVLGGRRGSTSTAAVIVSTAAVAWLLHSTVESTVVLTAPSAQPWLGTPELVVPGGFALWGLAAARGGGGADA